MVFTNCIIIDTFSLIRREIQTISLNFLINSITYHSLYNGNTSDIVYINFIFDIARVTFIYFAYMLESIKLNIHLSFEQQKQVLQAF